MLLKKKLFRCMQVVVLFILSIAPSLLIAGGGKAFGYGMLGGVVGSSLMAPRTQTTSVVYVDRSEPRKRTNAERKRALKAQLRELEEEESCDEYY